MDYAGFVQNVCTVVLNAQKLRIYKILTPKLRWGGVTDLFKSVLGAKKHSNIARYSDHVFESQGCSIPAFHVFAIPKQVRNDGLFCHPELVSGSQEHEDKNINAPALHPSNRRGNKAAFSLVELMLSLIIISLIAAAFAPVITKKLSASSLTIGGSNVNEITNECDQNLEDNTYSFGGDCELCVKKSCLVCAASCQNGTYKNTKTCTCDPCAMEGCAKCDSKNSCSECKNEYYFLNSVCTAHTVVENCAKYETEFDACQKCKSGYNLTDGKCEFIFKCSDGFCQIGNLFVTQYNMGDSDYTGIPFAAGVTVKKAGEVCSDTKCCWQGETAASASIQSAMEECDLGSFNCTSTNGSYSGCERTVCTWQAANAICANYNYDNKKWRLGTSAEVSTFGDYTKALGNNGLMLCSAVNYQGIYWWDYSNSTSSLCNPSSNCLGSGGNECYPNDIWASNMSGSSNVWLFGYNQEELTAYDSFSLSRARSVRCVVEVD